MEILPPRALWLGCNSPTPDAVEETQGLFQGGIAPEMSQSHHLIASSQAAGWLRQESGMPTPAALKAALWRPSPSCGSGNHIFTGFQEGAVV